MKHLILLLIAANTLLAAGFRAGTARVDITPDLPVWLSGYAARTHPAIHVLQPLWAKALAIEDGRGGRIVVVTMDLLGLPPEMAHEIALLCGQQFGLKREQLWLNSSHTHSGPAVWPNLRVIFDFNAEDQRRARDYSRKLVKSLTTIVGDALHNLKAAELSFGSGEADFAINRRIDRLRSLNPGRDFPAPIDHSVPVIQVKSPGGNILAVVFGYACHNTTITGEFYEVGGDYAGYAQAALEKSHAGAQAMYVMLCGGDQNPSPRSQLAHAEQHGNALAASVEKVLAGSMTTPRPRIRTAFSHVNLPLAAHTRETFEAEAKSSDVYHRRRAALMLADYDQGKAVRSIELPVQAIRFGDQTAIVALGGEVVVDYAARLKNESRGTPLVVAGYSNGVVSYIPSERILEEGGYEAVDSIMYYGLPTPYAPGVEERVVRAAHSVLRAVGVRRR